MIEGIKKKLILTAKDNPGIRNRVKVAAGILDPKDRLVSIGRNSYKTHPIMLNGDYREEQIFLHAEADAIVKALRVEKDLEGYKMYVVRVKRSPDGKWLEALAKPCKGCMSLIGSVGIDNVEWTQ